MEIDRETQTLRLLTFCAAHSLDVQHDGSKYGKKKARDELERAVRVLNWAYCQVTGQKNSRPFKKLSKGEWPAPNNMRGWLETIFKTRQKNPPLAKEVREAINDSNRVALLDQWVTYLYDPNPDAAPPRLPGRYDPEKANSPFQELIRALSQNRPSSPVLGVVQVAGAGAPISIDGCIELLALALSGTDELRVEYQAPKKCAIDLTSQCPSAPELRASQEGFDRLVRAFLIKRLRTQNPMDAQWKLGLRFAQLPSAHLDREARIVVRPLSYLVTELFNRAYVRRLAARHMNGEPSPLDAKLDTLVPACAAEVQSATGSFNLPFPSQLFIEVAIVSVDGQVLLMRKRNNPGVVAGVGRSWTCGPEYGLLASDLLPGSVVSPRAIIERALASEIGVAKGALVSWHVAGLALQRIHLNSALYGHCRLSLTGAELKAAFERKGGELRARGMPDPFHRGSSPGEPGAELVSLSELPRWLATERRPDGEWWHPTARKRLETVLLAP